MYVAKPPLALNTIETAVQGAGTFPAVMLQGTRVPGYPGNERVRVPGYRKARVIFRSLTTKSVYLDGILTPALLLQMHLTLYSIYEGLYIYMYIYYLCSYLLTLVFIFVLNHLLFIDKYHRRQPDQDKSGEQFIIGARVRFFPW